MSGAKLSLLLLKLTLELMTPKPPGLVNVLAGVGKEEKAQPFRDLAALPEVLKAIVVFALAFIEVAGEVEQRGRQPTPLPKVEGAALPPPLSRR